MIPTSWVFAILFGLLYIAIPSFAIVWLVTSGSGAFYLDARRIFWRVYTCYRFIKCFGPYCLVAIAPCLALSLAVFYTGYRLRVNIISPAEACIRLRRLSCAIVVACWAWLFFTALLLLSNIFAIPVDLQTPVLAIAHILGGGTHVLAYGAATRVLRLMATITNTSKGLPRPVVERCAESTRFYLGMLSLPWVALI